MSGPQHKLELGIDRALDGVYLAQEGLGELGEKPFGVATHLDAALREIREALALATPGEAPSRDQIAVPLALPADSDEVRQVFPLAPGEVRGTITPAGGTPIDVVRDPDGRMRRAIPSVPHPFVPPPDQ